MFSFHWKAIVPVKMVEPATISNITTFLYDCSKEAFESQTFKR